MARSNVLLVVVDSLRADAAFGRHIPTPNFDELAARGAAFRQCICTCTTTSPSFSSMLTGCYPPKHGVRGLQGYRLNPALKTLAELFNDAGYTTYAEVTGPLLPQTGILRGFSEVHHRKGYNAAFFGWRDEILGRMNAFREPWFMMLHLWEVHRPYHPPPDYARRMDRKGYERVVTATDERVAPIFAAAGDDATIVVTGDHGEDYPGSMLGYQTITYLRKLRRMVRLGRWWPSLDRKLMQAEIGHGFALYEHLVRVPFIMAGPAIAHAVVEDQVRHVDLLPTLGDICGLNVPQGLDGRSLRPALEGQSLSEEPAYMEAVGVKLAGDHLLAARTPDWKLVRTLSGRAALYRISDPPDEKKNVYKRNPEVARHLEAVIEQVNATDEVMHASGMTAEEEAVLEQHLRDLGYL